MGNVWPAGRQFDMPALEQQNCTTKGVYLYSRDNWMIKKRKKWKVAPLMFVSVSGANSGFVKILLVFCLQPLTTIS